VAPSSTPSAVLTNTRVGLTFLRRGAARVGRGPDQTPGFVHRGSARPRRFGRHPDVRIGQIGPRWADERGQSTETSATVRRRTHHTRHSCEACPRRESGTAWSGAHRLARQRRAALSPSLRGWLASALPRSEWSRAITRPLSAGDRLGEDVSAPSISTSPHRRIGTGMRRETAVRRR
jgi:hypothetical protein